MVKSCLMNTNNNPVPDGVLIFGIKTKNSLLPEFSNQYTESINEKIFDTSYIKVLTVKNELEVFPPQVFILYSVLMVL